MDRLHWLRYLGFFGLMLLVGVTTNLTKQNNLIYWLTVIWLIGMMLLFSFATQARLKLLMQLANREQENKELRNTLKLTANEFMTVAEHMWNIRMGKETQVERRQDLARNCAANAFLSSIKLLDAKQVHDILTSLGRLKDPNPMRDVLELEAQRIIKRAEPWRDVLLLFLHNGNYPREEPPPLPPRNEQHT